LYVANFASLTLLYRRRLSAIEAITTGTRIRSLPRSLLSVQLLLSVAVCESFSLFLCFLLTIILRWLLDFHNYDLYICLIFFLFLSACLLSTYSKHPRTHTSIYSQLHIYINQHQHPSFKPLHHCQSHTIIFIRLLCLLPLGFPLKIKNVVCFKNSQYNMSLCNYISFVIRSQVIPKTTRMSYRKYDKKKSSML